MTKTWYMSLYVVMAWIVSSKLALKQTRTIRTTFSEVQILLFNGISNSLSLGLFTLTIILVCCQACLYTQTMVMRYILRLESWL